MPGGGKQIDAEISCLQAVCHLLRGSEHKVEKVAPKNTDRAPQDGPDKEAAETPGRKRGSLDKSFHCSFVRK